MTRCFAQGREFLTMRIGFLGDFLHGLAIGLRSVTSTSCTYIRWRQRQRLLLSPLRPWKMYPTLYERREKGFGQLFERLCFLWDSRDDWSFRLQHVNVDSFVTLLR